MHKKHFICFLLLALLLRPVLADTTRGPYLQQLSDTSIIVRWRTSLSEASAVRYGTNINSLDGLTTNGTSTTEHEIKISGLTANTQYYYQIGTPSSVSTSGSTSQSFTTAPTKGTSKQTRFWVLGDSGTANSDAAAVRDAYKTYATSSTPADFLLMLGDNAYSSGTDNNYQQAVFDFYPDILAKTPLWAALGNHDGMSANSSLQTGVYFDVFSNPKLAEAGGVASGNESYYSFNYGDIHFVCLNSYDLDRGSSGAMGTWLKADLLANNLEWTIVFFHHPPYSKGSHDSDTETEHVEMRENILPILETYGVDLILSGHSHSYERSFLVDGHYQASSTLSPAMILNHGDGKESGNGAYLKPPGTEIANSGAVYIVAGSSGQVSAAALNHPVMQSSLSSLGSLIIDINGNRLDASFLNEAGIVKDNFSIIHSNDPDQDGVTNVNEVFDQTNPLDKGSHIRGFDTSACVEWNGFLEMYNFLELTNTSASNLSVVLSLYSNSGTLKTSKTINFTPKSQWDEPVHDLAGFEADSYGLVCVSHNGSSGDLKGQMLYYRPNHSSNSYDFALALSLSRGYQGKQAVTYNTYTPSYLQSELSNSIANWIQITNIGSEAASGVLKFFNENGEELSSESISLGSKGRVDVSAHRFGPSKIGYALWVPSSSSSSFIVRSLRYIYDNTNFSPSFLSAIVLDAGFGTQEKVIAPLNLENSWSILEITNLSDFEASGNLNLYNESGTHISTISLGAGFLPAHATKHIIASSYYPNKEKGLAIFDKNESNSLLVNVLNYRHSELGGLDYFYSMEASEPYGKSLNTSYNTFISQQAELILINSSTSSQKPLLSLFNLDGTPLLSSLEVNINALGLASINLNNYTPENIYGTVKVESTSNNISGFIVRRKGTDYGVPINVKYNRD